MRSVCIEASVCERLTINGHDVTELIDYGWGDLDLFSDIRHCLDCYRETGALCCIHMPYGTEYIRTVQIWHPTVPRLRVAIDHRMYTVIKPYVQLQGRQNLDNRESTRRMGLKRMGQACLARLSPVLMGFS
jgi:hypothetical protein